MIPGKHVLTTSTFVSQRAAYSSWRKRVALSAHGLQRRPAYTSGLSDDRSRPLNGPSRLADLLAVLTQSGLQLLPSLPESPHWYGSARQWGSSALLVVRLVGANGPVDHAPIGQRSDTDT
jgi:hypothetical protein